MSPQELLAKASLTLTDFGGAGEAPLTIEQVRQFLRIAITPQAMLPDVRTVSANANQWDESKIDFAARVMRAGTEFTRLADGDRVKPTTGVVTISTKLIRGEVPVSDEVLEDQVEQAGFGDTLMTMIGEAVGRDVEELMINGDTGSGDTYLALLDGWLKQAQTGTGNHAYDATTDAGDYQNIFKNLLMNIPDKYKRGLATDWRYYAPTRLVEAYRDALAARGTPLGDMSLTGENELRYQSILIKPVPNIAITAGSPDTSKILLAPRRNLYAGWRRRIRIETYRDPREGGMSFVVSARVDAEIANIDATSLAYNVNVEP